MTAHDAYRTWFNDFLTTKYFAEYFNIPHEHAKKLISEGRKIEEEIQKIKDNCQNQINTLKNL